MPEDMVRAVDIARGAKVDPKRLRHALRQEGLPWHAHGAFWTVRRDSSEHRDMLRVLARLQRGD